MEGQTWTCCEFRGEKFVFSEIEKLACIHYQKGSKMTKEKKNQMKKILCQVAF